jgi:hypothetical protein
MLITSGAAFYTDLISVVKKEEKVFIRKAFHFLCVTLVKRQNA